ncbi:MAG: PEGA domain-containing protein [Deltaproteobacteria bacterium]|nr:PEGA domain-containing protein [Deltaproteobacteria bacterium]
MPNRPRSTGPRRVPRPLALLLGAVWLAGAAWASAQPAEDDDPLRQTARERYQQARGLLEQGDAVAALSEFAASHQLYANWPSLYGMAMCQEALGRPAAALELYQQVLREFGESVPDSERVAIGGRIAEIQEQIGTPVPPDAALGRLALRSTPVGAVVCVDGVEAGSTPLQVDVSVGPHRVEVRLEGYESATRWVDVAEGQTADVEFGLVALGGVPGEGGALLVRADPGGTVFVDGRRLGLAPVGPHAVSPGEYLVRVEGDDGRVWEETVEVSAGRTMVVEVRLGAGDGLDPLWFWLTAGTAGALAVGGAATGGYVLSLKDEYDDPATAPTRRDEIKSTGDPLRVVTDALLGAAGAVAIGAITLLFFTDFEGDGVSADVGPLDSTGPAVAGGAAREW